MSNFVMLTGTLNATRFGSRYEPDWWSTKFCQGKNMFRGIFGGLSSVLDRFHIRSLEGRMGMNYILTSTCDIYVIFSQ